MKKLLLIAIVALVLAYHRMSGGPIDGTAWEVRLKSDSFFSFSQKHTLIFQDGKASVLAYLPEGFPAEYYRFTPTDKPEEAVWKTSFYNDRKGSVEWEGKIRGKKMRGTVVWTDPGGTVRRYRFTASRRAA